MFNCILAGVGGQGTVLASKLIADAVMKQGRHVRTAETIGMAQRGGGVVSHLRLATQDGENIDGAMIPRGQADIIIGFEPAEAAACLSYLKKNGVMVVSSRPIKATTGDYDAAAVLDYLSNKVHNITIVDTQAVVEQLGSARVLNVALLGAAVGCGALCISEEEAIASVKSLVKPQFVELNLKAFEVGRQAVI